MLKDLAVAAAVCLAVVVLAAGINAVEIPQRHRFLFWWAVAVLPACVALPLLGRYNVLTAVAVCLSTVWLGWEYLGDGDAGAGIVPALVIGIGLAGFLPTLLAWGYSRGMHL